MAIHSSILAWRIPWTEEPGGLWSRGWQSQTRLTNTHIYPYVLQRFPFILRISFVFLFKKTFYVETFRVTQNYKMVQRVPCIILHPTLPRVVSSITIVQYQNCLSLDIIYGAIFLSITFL